VRITWPSGESDLEVYEYDVAERLVKKTVYDGALTDVFGWEYDEHGNLVWEWKIWDVATSDQIDSEIRYEYDDANRLMVRTDSYYDTDNPSRTIQYYTHDGNGRIVSSDGYWTPAGETVEKAYNHADYRYTPEGLLSEFEVTELDPDNQVPEYRMKCSFISRYSYNEQNKKTRAEYWVVEGYPNPSRKCDRLGSIEIWTYDTRGLLVQYARDSDGVPDGITEIVEDYSYDNQGFLTEANYGSGSLVFTNDFWGNVLQQVRQEEHGQVESVDDYSYECLFN
jgi:hypothetical protein